MPITKSAKKALRGSERKRRHNLRTKSNLKQVVKNIKKLIVEKKTDEAKKLMPQVQAIIDKAAKTNVLKKNNAARKKSRISAMLKKASE